MIVPSSVLKKQLRWQVWAGSAGLFDLVYKAVLIAIDKDLLNLLEMPALFSFFPEFFSAPGCSNEQIR